MLETIKKYKKPILFIILTMIIVALGLLTRQTRTVNDAANATPAPTPVVEAQGEWGRLGDIVTKLGEPLNRKSDRVKNGVYYYESGNANKKTQVVFRDNVAVMMKEIISSKDTRTAVSITKTLGDEELILYGELSELGYHLYAYPSKGVAYVGDKQSGSLMEIWYFSPMSKEEFDQSLARDYSTAPELDGY